MHVAVQGGELLVTEHELVRREHPQPLREVRRLGWRAEHGLDVVWMRDAQPGPHAGHGEDEAISERSESLGELGEAQPELGEVHHGGSPQAGQSR